MKGDCYRYMAEIHDGVTSSTKLALASYDKAWTLVEILNAPDRGIQLAKQAFDDAMRELDMPLDIGYIDTTVIMQLLRDNITLWLAAKRRKRVCLKDNITTYIRSASLDGTESAATPVQILPLVE
ncbi:hypothetical protein DYB37_010668 [Aphanomyces astaci]|uniref:14-3-3 domain-containing protein n=1 Tax=Aphanomyces astaci TaxID=112090 RepID=A0A397DMJ4_APHAT|nr:hypothetical protein DYB34_010478 [Aphanomyces astaci]RHY64751.1 hypothetical protein DYB38_006037 [Aphanomyces astaci]RHY67272.1 hypothetical protein DYB30_010602 [Aphanomyces astaci]RHY82955.1 hypothetical protein DYB35_012921 [Aphanomyces astaci]RHZ07108.1 hypothetical protein DYB31_006920 [Aphanomyces astaci]